MLLGNQAPYLTGVQACFQPGAMIYDLVDQRHETNKKKEGTACYPLLTVGSNPLWMFFLMSHSFSPGEISIPPPFVWPWNGG
mmetsp:Transcript_11681/g.23485  ORF Transcript_11681/g.23485 Transcript_11681/m.23485 type:complete len:82 (+) Transcript_11681:431-676(+)